MKDQVLKEPMDFAIRILLVEDNPGDVRLLKEKLAGAETARFEITCVDQLDDAIKNLSEGHFEIVLLDLSLPDSHGLETFTKAFEHSQGVPIVVMSGLSDETIAVKAVQGGAQDYLVKGQADTGVIVRAIHYAIERNKAQQSLNDSEEKHRAISQAAMDAIIMLDNDGKIIEWNQAAEVMFGYPREEAFGKDLHALLAPGRYHDLYKKGFAGFRETGEGAAVGNLTKLEALKKDGTEFPVELSISAVQIKGRWHAVGIVRDITERQEMEKMKSEFLSIASHELRTPMTSIKNAVEIIVKGKAGEVNETQAKFLSMADRNIKRLSALINDLLDISKIESNKMQFNYSHVDIRKSVEHVFNTLKPLSDTKSLTLKADIADNTPAVYADDNRIEEVLLNLVGNAIKFTDNRGKIKVAAQVEKEVSDAGLKDFLEITVEDEGVGIAKEHLDHIFDKFYQVGGSLGRRYDSTGLGLSISKGIIEGHGGKMRCESEEGKGSRFIFTVPILIEAEEFHNIMRKDISEASEQNYPLSILIIGIEDFERVRETAAKEEIESILEKVKEAIRWGGLKTTDRLEILPDSGEVVMVMHNTSSKGARVVQGKIEQLTGDIKGMNSEGCFLSGCAVFPDNGETIELLLDFARENIREPQRV
jgi:PAS domain S-box-containing protein